mgnify:FL=1
MADRTLVLVSDSAAVDPGNHPRHFPRGFSRSCTVRHWPIYSMAILRARWFCENARRAVKNPLVPPKASAVRISVLSTIAALSVCLSVPATAQTLMRTTPRQSAHAPGFKVGRDRIEEVQRALEGKGFDVGEIDGKIGSKTEHALRTFQKSQRLPVSGQIDRATLARLRDQIRAVQRALRRKGYDISVVDGTFGDKTERALREFQKGQGLPVSGRFDERTLSALKIGRTGAARNTTPAPAKAWQKRHSK